MEDIIDIIVTETTNLIEITSQPTDEVIDVNIIDNREDITLNVTPSVVEININSLTGNFGVEWGDITGTLSNQTDLNTALSLKADLVDGKVPSSQLPSYVDDVVEVANYASLPATGEVGKIYITLDTNFIYRWTGSTYVEIKDSSAVWGAITGTLSSQTDLQSALDAKQNQLNGTGFVKASGTTISYDNSTYLKGSLSDGFIPYWSSSLGALTNSFIEKFGNFTQIGGSGLDVFNGMTVSGRYDNVANAPKIFSSDESTGMAHISFINSGGGFNLGVNKSTANGLMSGASAYATVLTSLQATNLEFGTDATKRLTINGTTGNATFESSVGIGSTSLTGYNLRISKNITGATTSYGVMNDGIIQSDATDFVQYYTTIASTSSTSFTVGSLYHYNAFQGSIGASSSITNQYGFIVSPTLIGATNNYGFYGNIPSGTNRWNLYMNGTAQNFLKGNTGIGGNPLTVFSVGTIGATENGSTSYGASVIMGSNYTLSNTQRGILDVNMVDITAQDRGATLTFSNNAGQFGQGYNYVSAGIKAGKSNATNQNQTSYLAFYVNSGGTLSERARLDNFGSLGIGTTSLTGYSLRVSKNITGAVSSNGVFVDGTIQSDATTAAIGYGTLLTTQAASFTLGSLYHFRAQQTTLGAGSTVNLQVGFDVANTLTGATQNIAFRSLLNAGTNVWNLYMNGTASNYLAGSLGIGNTSVAVFNLRVDKNVTGGTTAYGGYFGGNVQSDVTSQMFGVMSSYGTQATTFTLSNLYNFHVVQGTFGAGSTVTNQHGFSVASSLIGATNNYGFRGQIASGTGRWNLYMDGTANNYLAGKLLIGSNTDSGYKLLVSGSNQADSTIGMIYTSVGAYSQFITSGGAFVMGLDGSTGSTERLRITSIGNVGINTSTPASFTGYTVFTVNGSSNGGMTVLQYQGTNSLQTYSVSSESGIYELRNNPLAFGTNNTLRMTIKANGIINLSNVPTSSAGLSSGDIYKTVAGVLMIV